MHIINQLNSSTVNIISMQFIYVSIILLFFQGKLYKKILYYITATVVMIGSEFLFIVLLSLDAGFALSYSKNNPLIIIVSMLGIKLITFVLLNILKRISKNTNDKMGLKNTLLYSTVPLSLLGIMIALARLDINFASKEWIQPLLLISCILAMIGNIIIFYIFDRYAQSTWKLQQQEIQITRLGMEKKHYGQLEQVNQEHAAFLHDIRHYMKAIGEMASEDNNTGIVSILSELQIKVSEAESIQLCQNPLLNTILNEKRKEAEKKHISIQIKVEPDCTINQIEDMDLIAIIGNLMDNAIEAAQKCRQGYIKTYLFNHNSSNISVMKIVNNYEGKIEMEDGHLLTSKEDKMKHGFGVQNVQSIVEKYNGYVQNFYDEHEYTVVVVLPN
ncbi:MAG: GHKL domain-containing protein [Lachnospiraceae bacterium]|nr:GHKL domain-containing protein [Lachnospiraceae bacterium]